MSSSSSSIEIREIDFTPHYFAITSAGKSQFSRVCDGIAELIDNSIQACVDNSIVEERNISISIFLCGDSKFSQAYASGLLFRNGYLMVADNGCGMDQNCLSEFAIYSLDIKSRNLHRNYSNSYYRNSFISKFGVGAKQAGFFLGKSIQVFTKRKESNSIHELLLDQDEFRARHERGEVVYKTNIVSRSVSETATLVTNGILPPTMISRVVDFIKANGHFTIVIIQLHTDIVKKLLHEDRYQRLPDELAEIYHFHLHPNHIPNEIINEFQPDSNRIEGFPYPRAIRGHREAFGESPKLNLSIDLTDGDIIKLPFILISEVKDTVTKCLKQAKQAFAFTMTIPDPQPGELDNTSIAVLNQLGGEVTGADINKYTVEGIIFYFPYSEGRETRPYSHSTLFDDTSSTDMSDDGDSSTNLDKDPTFSIYWQDRLVPESTFSSLPFFPSCRTRFECAKDDIPEKWRLRIKGFLFFDWHFQHISNNKLKIRIEGFEQMLNSKDSKIRKRFSVDPNEKQFKRWLQLCHKNFDQELNYDRRDRELESLLKKLPGRNALAPCEGCFSRLEFGSSRIIIEKNDLIKVKSKGKGAVYGKVVGFRTNSSLDLEDKYFGSASLVYVRQPEDIFGPNIAKDFPSVGKLNLENCKVNREEIKGQLLYMKPSDLRVFLHTDYESSQEVDALNGLEVFIGEDYYKFAVQLYRSIDSKKKGHKKEQIVHIPQSTSIYRVQLIYDTQEQEGGKSLWMYDPQEKVEVKQQSKDIPNANIPFLWYNFSNYEKPPGVHPLKFQAVGTFKLTINVIDEETSFVPYIVLTKTFTIRVKSPQIADFALDMNEKEMLSPRPLGSFLPGFTVRCLDDHDNTVPYAGIVKLTVKSDYMNIVAEEGMTDPKYELLPDENGTMSFIDGQWIPSPKNGIDFFDDSTNVRSTRTVTFTVSLFTCEEKQNQKYFDTIVGNVKTFEMTFTPGRPHSLIMLEPATRIFRSNDLPTLIRFGCVDQWGNRTGPSQDRIWLLKYDDGCFKFDETEVVASESGEFSLSPIGIHSDRLGDVFSEINLRQVFEAYPRGGEDFIASPSKKKDSSKHTISIGVDFTIIPSSAPSRIQICYKGSPIDEPWCVPVNTEIDDLSFHLLTDTNDLIEFQPEWFRFKDSGVTVSWDYQHGRVKKPRRVTSNHFPNIKIPKEIKREADHNFQESEDGSLQLVYTVKVIFGKGFELTEQFAIVPEPLHPVRYEFLVSADVVHGISNGDPEDFARKVSVIAVDEFRNCISSRTKSHLRPYIAVSWNSAESDANSEDALYYPPRMKRSRKDHDDDESDDEGDGKRRRIDDPLRPESVSESRLNRIELIPATDGSKFVVQPGSCLSTESMADSPIKVNLCVRDKLNNALRSPWKRFALIAGPPHRLAVSCQSCDLMEPVTAYSSILVNRFSDIRDVQIHVFDRSYNLAAFSSTQQFLYNVDAQPIVKGAVLDVSVPVIVKRKVKNDKFGIGRIQVSSLKTSMEELIPGLLVRDFQLIFKASFVDTAGLEVILQPATIDFKLEPLNIVNEVNLIVAGRDQSTGSNEFPFPCDGSFPDLEIRFIRDDGVELIPSLDDIDMIVRYARRAVTTQSNKREKKNFVDVSSQFLLAHSNTTDSMDDVLGGHGKIVLTHTPPAEGSKFRYPLVGDYEIRITYNERREFVKHLPEAYHKTIGSKTVRITHGKPVKLRPNPESDIKLQSRSVCGSSNPSSRVIGIDIGFKIVDAQDNECVDISDVYVCCSIVSLGSDFAPHLAGADESGRVFATSGPNATFLFPNLSIDPVRGGQNCEFLLRFQAIGLNILPCEVSVQFTTSESIQQSISVKSMELHRLNEQVRNHEENIKANEVDLTRNKLEILHRMKRASSVNLKHEKDNLSGWLDRRSESLKDVINDLSERMSQLKSQYSDMERYQTQVRQPAIPESLRVMQGRPGVRGLVAELGYVNDEDEAMLLSWVAAQYMDCFIVESTADSQSLYRSRFKSMSLDQIIPFTVVYHDHHGNRAERGRNEEERNKRTLPLPVLDGVAGNPRYLINMIQLDDANEDLRDTVFYTIFRRALIFDDLSTALEYRRRLVREKKPPPLLLTKLGDRIGTDGMLNPSSNNQMPKDRASCRYLFGEQPRSQGHDLRTVQSDINIMEATIELMTVRNTLIARYQTLQDENENIEKLRADIADLQRELASFGGFTQP